jgi:ammonia channel protein AmtB
MWAACPLKAIMGIRVNPEEEFAGLNISEHGIMAYPEFRTPSESLPERTYTQPV